MSGPRTEDAPVRVTLLVDQAADVFYLAVGVIESGQRLDDNQIDSLRSLADKLDYQSRKEMREARGLGPHVPLIYHGHRQDLEDVLPADRRIKVLSCPTP